MSDLLARARTHLHAIAREPRAAGSAADDAARRYAAESLRAQGFSVAEHPFAYSAFPGRYATPAFGLVAVVALASSASLGGRGAPGSAFLVLGLTCAALVACGAWLSKRGVLRFPAFRARGVNLAATRASDAPRVWLVAHTDSKSQPVPQAARAAGIIMLGSSLAAALVLSLLQHAGAAPASGTWWLAITAAGILGGLPVMASFVGNRSVGALDNASGLASVLLAAEVVPRDVPLGVLVTAAEELGLAGARAWAASAGRGQIALNCDGVDDVGVLTGMYSNARGGRVLAAFDAAAQAAGYPYRSIRLVPGILVDAVALADAGWETATLSRGSLRTLARVHTEQDRLDRLDGKGIPEAAVVLAAAAQRLAREGAR